MKVSQDLVSHVWEEEAPEHREPRTGAEERKGHAPLLSYPAGQASLPHPLVPSGSQGSTFLTRELVRSNECKYGSMESARTQPDPKCALDQC